MGFLTRDELAAMGLRAVGEGVRISDKASIHGASRVSLGDHVRIDDFCVLSAGEGGITVGRNVHIAVYSCLIGAGHISLGDFANISSRVAIYSSNDDYSGEWMTNPTVPAQYTNVTHDEVRIGAHAIVGSGTVVLPGVTIGEGAAIGALGLVRVDCEPFGVYAGVPVRKIKERRRELLKLADAFLAASPRTDA